ncbi:MAG: radical SAM protein [Candidatus Bathyarchaeia archaeon]
MKKILSESKVHDYTINPYLGCEHGCTYCYARFMKRFSGHKEAWGEFIDIKTNAPSLLKHEVERKRVGPVWVSGICDPYQPIEKRYELTRRCLEILIERSWPIVVQTKSPLVLRDIDILRNSRRVEVGLTITTADDEIRRIFEPKAPPIQERIGALEQLHSASIKTFAMIAPLLPRTEDLAEQLSGRVDYVLIDRMNYHYADHVYRKYGFEDEMDDKFFMHTKVSLASAFNREGIPCRILY